MKIYDIISENNIQESPVDWLKLAGRGIVTGAKWLAQTGSRRDLIDMMAKDSRIIRNALRGTPPTVAQIEATYGPRAAEMFGKDPNFMAKVIKKYHADRAIKNAPPPPKNAPPPPPPVQLTSKLSGAVGPTWDKINKWTSLLGVAVPIAQCAWSITQAYSKQAAGDPAYQGAELSKHIQAAFDTCVGQLIALGIGRGLIKVGMVVPKSVFGAFVTSTKLTKFLDGTTRAGQTAFTAWLLSPPGQKALAEYTVGNAFGASEFKWVRDTAAGYVMTGYDDLMNYLGKPLPDRDTTVQNRATAAANKDNAADILDLPVPKSMFSPTGALLK